MFFLNLLAWTLCGLLIGFVANRVVNLRGDDPRLALGASTAGALIAGVLYLVISSAEGGHWTWIGLAFAAGGALVAVVTWHAVRSRTISHARYVPRRSY